MAERPVFYVENELVKKRFLEFEWFSGFAVSQKQKSIDSLHRAIRNRFPGASALEVSTKSKVVFGNRLSAFNLKIDGYFLENVFQASKVFENGGPYIDLLDRSPKDAKRDERLKISGKLISFRYKECDWPLIPKSVFYDYLYYVAVQQNFSLDDLEEFKKYSFFTDIEFNPNRSLNTQARSAALIRLALEKCDHLTDIADIEKFIEFHEKFVAG